MMIGMKEVVEATIKRFADSPLGKMSEGKVFDKPMSEYDKPLAMYAKDSGEKRPFSASAQDEIHTEKNENGDGTESDQNESAQDEERNEKQEELDDLVDEYFDDLVDNSEYPETIENDGSPWEKVTPEENAKKREEFEDNKKDNPQCKENLIKEWEEKHGKEWPRYKEDVYVNGKLIRKAGDRYDAHHIKPLSFGGKNEVSNITPISAEKHFDKQGIHSPNSPYGRIETLSKGA